MTHRLLIATAAATLLAACGNADNDVERAAERAGNDIERTVNTTTERMDTTMDRGMDSGMADTKDMDLDDLEMTFDVINASGMRIGSIELEHSDDGVEVEFDVTSLPEGTLAVHFHENGSCDTPDFKSAGGHFNPKNVMHGRESATGPHAGDMPNVEVPRSGMLKTEIENTNASLLGHDGLPALLDANGSALIIHAGADDYQSQPSGAAGERIACAVISR